LDDVLTITEIEAQFASEWILVADPLINESLEVQSVKVYWHSKERDEVYRKAVELRPERFAVENAQRYRSRTMRDFYADGYHGRAATGL